MGGEDCWQTGEGRSQTDITLKGSQEDLLDELLKVNKNVVVNMNLIRKTFVELHINLNNEWLNGIMPKIVKDEYICNEFDDFSIQTNKSSSIRNFLSRRKKLLRLGAAALLIALIAVPAMKFLPYSCFKAR